MPDRVQTILGTSDENLDRAWETLQGQLRNRLGAPSVGVEGILFLIGVQARGIGYQPNLRKEKKQDLIMDGTHAALETLGIYGRVLDAEGGEHWERRIALPELSVEEQEKLLRVGILRYFETHADLDVSL